jgi:hypothetical protein
MPRLSMAFVLVGCLLTAACGGNSGGGAPTSPTTGDIKVDISMTVVPGQRVTVDGTTLTVQFIGVASDSRCPADALCVTQGDAVAVFEASVAASAGARLELGTSNSRRTAEVGTYSVELRGLDPYPFASLPPIQPSDYRATLRVVSR